MNCKNKIQLITLLILINSAVFGQSVEGIWQGYITNFSGYGLNSGYTLHIKKKAGNIITGHAYIYKDDIIIFDGVLDFVGAADKNILKITELEILRSKLPDDTTFLCYKLLHLTLSHKNNFDYLTGNWNGSIYNKDQCIPGKVYLRRYSPDDPKGIEPMPASVLQKITNDKGTDITFLKTVLSPPIFVNVNRRSFSLELRDYLREDNDTVTVYFNRKIKLEKVALTKKVKKFSVELDRTSSFNEIIMYADNLGRIPPNTSVMTIDDGITKQQVMVESNKQKSAVIYIKYEPQKLPLSKKR